MQNEQPEIKELTEKQVAFVSYTGNYMGNLQIFKNLFDKLCGWAAPMGLISPETVFLFSSPLKLLMMLISPTKQVQRNQLCLSGH